MPLAFLRRKSSSRRHLARHTKIAARRLFLEPLEDRRVMATVSVGYFGPEGSENSEPVKFYVTRSPDISGNLTVYFNYGGTASDNDYPRAASVIIPDGMTDVLLQMVPTDDSRDEGTESVIINITPDSAYTIGSGTATSYILDNDRESGAGAVPDDTLVCDCSCGCSSVDTAVNLNNGSAYVRSFVGGPLGGLMYASEAADPYALMQADAWFGYFYQDSGVIEAQYSFNYAMMPESRYYSTADFVPFDDHRFAVVADGQQIPGSGYYRWDIDVLLPDPSTGIPTVGPNYPQPGGAKRLAAVRGGECWPRRKPSLVGTLPLQSSYQAAIRRKRRIVVAPPVLQALTGFFLLFGPSKMVASLRASLS